MASHPAPSPRPGTTGRTVLLKGARLWRSGRKVDVLLPAPVRGDLIDETGLLTDAGGCADVREFGPAQIVVDCTGCILSPALADPHVHFREPGGTRKEDMSSGSAAAVAGGYGRVLIMPNTDPAIDGAPAPDGGPGVIDYLQHLRRADGRALPVEYSLCAAASAGREGREASRPGWWAPYLPGGAASARDPMAAAHPVVALSDDGDAVTDATLDQVASNALAYGLPILDHCERHETGVMNEGAVSRRMGLPGIPASTELAIVRRDVDLAARTGVHVHLQHVSTAGAFQAIRLAKEKGVPVTCETAPHYLALCDKDLPALGAMAKMNPPLRSDEDRLATLRAVADGTVDMIATDHAPHTAEEKSLGLLSAPNGIVGLETAYGVCRQVLVSGGWISHERLVELMSLAPSRLMQAQVTDPEDLAHPAGSSASADGVRVGAPGAGGGLLVDLTAGRSTRVGLTLLDPDAAWTVDAASFHSKGRNTPFQGMTLCGRPLATIVRSELVFSRLPSARAGKPGVRTASADRWASLPQEEGSAPGRKDQ